MITKYSKDLIIEVLEIVLELKEEIGNSNPWHKQRALDIQKAIDELGTVQSQEEMDYIEESCDIEISEEVASLLKKL